VTAAAVWLAVSTGHQETDNQVPDVERFAAHHGYEVVCRYEVIESRWNGGMDGGEYRRMLKQALDDAHQGKFAVIVVWALDRITREGAEGALRIIRQFRERGCAVVSVKESWLNGSPEVQDVLVAFAGWMAQQESQRRSERIRAGLERRRVEGKPVGRQPGAADKKPRKRAGYVASWEGGRRRAAHDARVVGPGAGSAMTTADPHGAGAGR
jgi:putative DNA-invertase from lambdoid prophage Rac